MRNVGWMLLAALLGAVHTCAAESAGAPPRFDVGGGLDVGGFFGDTGDDWSTGMGGLIFAQVPWKHDLEGRVLIGMVWNDGSNEPSSSSGPDLGGEPGDRPDEFRRTNIEGSLLWRVERLAIEDYGVPYLGAGIGTYERRAEYRPPVDATSPGTTSSGWDAGFHGLAGVRFYRTSGLFMGLEGGVRWIDTPEEWTEAYDVSFLLGVQLGI